MERKKKPKKVWPNVWKFNYRHGYCVKMVGGELCCRPLNMNLECPEAHRSMTTRERRFQRQRLKDWGWIDDGENMSQENEEAFAIFIRQKNGKL